jgi:hypothetical protein
MKKIVCSSSSNLSAPIMASVRPYQEPYALDSEAGMLEV